MATVKEDLRHKIIVEYWCRMLNTYTIKDIIEVIKDYSKAFELFEKILCDQVLTFNQERTIMARNKDDGARNGWKNGFGSIIAKPGNCYEWKIEIIEHKEDSSKPGDIFIGIIEADKCDKDYFFSNQFFYQKNYTIAYLSDTGHYYTGKDINTIGNAPYGVGDIIGVHLDLKQNILYFSKNEKKHDDIKGMIEQNTEYRLIVSFFNMGNAQKIEIVEYRQW